MNRPRKKQPGPISERAAQRELDAAMAEVKKVIGAIALNLADPDEAEDTALFLMEIFHEGMMVGGRFACTRPVADLQAARCIGNAFTTAMRAVNQRRMTANAETIAEHMKNCPNCKARTKTAN